MTTQIQHTTDEPSTVLSQVIPLDWGGARLDQAVARLWCDYSRERLKEWISQGHLLVDGKIWRPKDRVVGGENISLEIKLDVETEAKPQNIPLNIIYEDSDILVLDKPAGLVVHPGAGNPDGTLFTTSHRHSRQRSYC